MANMIRLILVIIGVVLMLDDLVFHWFGDLSWMDAYIHHWQLGLVLIILAILFTLPRRKKAGL